MHVYLDECFQIRANFSLFYSLQMDSQTVSFDFFYVKDVELSPLFSLHYARHVFDDDPGYLPWAAPFDLP